MLNIEKGIPLKQTQEYLANFERFSLIEKIEPKFFLSSTSGSRQCAEIVRDTIIAKNKQGKTCVLGMATGSTPLKVYKELVGMYNRGEVSFKNVVTFNLDEYYPISKDNLESYYFYMFDNLFNHIDIPKENVNIPDGEAPRDKVAELCEEYENKIKSYGGIDLQILGVGRTGHIGFNEPPSPIKSKTRLVYLHRLTRKDAINSFGGMQNVPKSAITMGIETISKAKKIIIMAWSQAKASIIKKSIQGEKKNEVPSTFLQDHPDAVFFLDMEAGSDLSRFNIPWTIKGDKEDPIVPKSKYWVLKMIIWLSHQVNKPILRLTFEDYEDYEMSSLVMGCAHGHTEDLNLFAYKQILSRISGWPLGGRGEYNAEQGHILNKTTKQTHNVLVFSPHPDDDVISMGGTLRKLVQQGHKVSVAYMVAGSNSVHDYQTQKYLYFVRDFLNSNSVLEQFRKSDPKFEQYSQKLISMMDEGEKHMVQKKNTGELTDVDVIKHIKGLIRSSQAKIAVNQVGISSNDVYCLNLPFYTHHSKRKQPTAVDVNIIEDLLKVVKPTAIYAAGDLTDPHKTHRRCLDMIIEIINREYKKAEENQEYSPIVPPPHNIFFYRGAWQEWEIPMARYIVPLSPSEVERKVTAITKHESQKENPMFPGDDKRQFWLRSKERNRNTAIELNNLGLPNYQAAEVFIDLNDLKAYEDF